MHALQPPPVVEPAPGPGPRLALLRASVAASLLAAALAAQAHDTWFEARGQRGAGDTFLSLGTGNQFPLHDTAVDAQYLDRSGCRQRGQPVPLDAVANTATTLLLRARARGPAAVSCWAQLVAFDIELEPALIPLYFEEANASAAVREAWRELQARGVRWKERYTKHARIEIDGDGQPGSPADTGHDDMAMDLQLLERPPRPLQAGDSVCAQLLRDGQPLAGLALELRRAGGGAGAWHTTDARGRVALHLPAADRWLLRGIDIRPSLTEPGAWQTRFVTLAFGVRERAAAAVPAPPAPCGN